MKSYVCANSNSGNDGNARHWASLDFVDPVLLYINVDFCVFPCFLLLSLLSCRLFPFFGLSPFSCFRLLSLLPCPCFRLRSFQSLFALSWLVFTSSVLLSHSFGVALSLFSLSFPAFSLSCCLFLCLSCLLFRSFLFLVFSFSAFLLPFPCCLFPCVLLFFSSTVKHDCAKHVARTRAKWST